MNKSLKLCLRTILSLSFVTLPYGMQAAFGAELAGVKFEETAKLDDTALVLNGLGLRKFAFFKVYAGALYLKEKSSSDLKILSSEDPKMIKMHFLRDVSSKDIQKAWKEGYERNCPKESCALFKAQVEEMNRLMKDCKEGDSLEFNFSSKSLKLIYNGTALGSIEKDGFSRSILGIFLGKNPPNESLKKGLLGIQ